MGQLATYISIDEPRLETFWWLDDKQFRKCFLEIEEDQNLERLELDKIWDVLHCTLTGVSASTPVTDNKLSEAVVGVQPKIYDDGDYSIFVSVIENDDLPAIILALEDIDYEKLVGLLNPDRMKQQKIYPCGIWTDPPEQLLMEMDAAIRSMKNFYRKSLVAKHHVLATVL
jgi:hypothetical protein